MYAPELSIPHQPLLSPMRFIPVSIEHPFHILIRMTPIFASIVGPPGGPTRMLP